MRPPARLVSLAGKVHEGIGLWLTETVSLAQVHDLAGGGVACADLNLPDLGRGARQPCGHIILGQAQAGPQFAQACAKFTLAYGRAHAGLG